MKLIRSYTGVPRINSPELVLPKVKGDEFCKLYEWLEQQSSIETLTYNLIDPIIHSTTFETVPTGGVQIWCKDEKIMTLLQLGWG